MAWGQWGSRCRRAVRIVSTHFPKATHGAHRPGLRRDANVCCWISAGAFTSATRTSRIRTLDSAADGQAIFKRREIFFPRVRLHLMTVTGESWTCRTTGRSSCPSPTILRCRAKDSIPWDGRIRRRAWAGTAASSTFWPKTQRNGSRWRLPREHGGLQWLLHRHPQRRI